MDHEPSVKRVIYTDLKFPYWVGFATYCRKQTNSRIKFTPHGIVKETYTTPIDVEAILTDKRIQAIDASLKEE